MLPIAFASHRIEDLADRLSEFLLAAPLADPMAAEFVVVPSRGMERWLSMRLSQSATVAMNFRFLFPARAIRELVRDILGDTAQDPADTDPWDPEALTFQVLAALPSLMHSGDFAPLRQYLQAGCERGEPGGPAAGSVSRREYLLARRIADLFDRYATFRPDWTDAWLRPGFSFPTGIPGFDPATRWQALLYRAVSERIGQPHPATRIQEAIAALRSCAAVDRLPQRVSVFGISSLPPVFLDLLSALGTRIPLALFVVSPVGGYFGDLPDRREKKRIVRNAASAPLSSLHLEDSHPLLQSMGRTARDFNRKLCETDLEVCECAPAPGPDAALSMLGRIQSDLYHLIRRDIPGGHAPLRISRLDGSIQVHSCHGNLRQVEVLRDCLLRLLRDDPDIDPRDIVVMTPDIDTFAPLIDAIFSDGDAREGDSFSHKDTGKAGFPALRFNIADRSQAVTNSVAQALTRILSLPSSRITASDVLGLLDLELVARRLDFNGDDLAKIRRWVAESGIRWGIDSGHREAFLGLDTAAKTEEADLNSWRFGLDRLLLGVAVPGEDSGILSLPGGDVLPFDGIEGEDSRVLGRFSSFCETLFDACQFLERQRSATVSAWRERLADLMDAFLDIPDEMAGHAAQVILEFRRVEQASEGLDRDIDLDVVLSLLEELLGPAPKGAGLLSGGVNFCAMVPMRTLPFQVVCLLGMDDGAFPGPENRPDFDLIATDPRPRVGDRSKRDEERYLFLEALLSARKHLLIFFNGRSVRDNEPLPPAVPVGEFLDLVSRTFALADPECPHSILNPETLRGRLVREHPLQPFGIRMFSRDDLDPEKPRGFDLRALSGARRLAGQSGLPGPAAVFGRPLPDAPDPWVVSVDDLARFLQHPIRHLLKRRLGLSLEETETELLDRETFGFDKLQEWKFGERMLAAFLADERADPNGILRKITLEGRMPPGNLRIGLLDDVIEQARAVADSALALGVDLTPNSRRDVDLQAGRLRITGTLDTLRTRDQVIVGYGSPRPKRILDAWVRHVMACARDPAFSGTTYLIGKGQGDKGRIEMSGIPGDPAISLVDRARACLDTLAAWYVQGWYRPFLLFPTSSFQYYDTFTQEMDGENPDAAAADRKARDAARKEGWITKTLRDAPPGEDQDPWIRWALEDAEPWADPVDGIPPPFPFPVEAADRPEAVALTVWSEVDACWHKREVTP